MQTVSSQNLRKFAAQRPDCDDDEHDQIMIRLTVNGSVHDADAAPDTALLYVLRNDLELYGP
jgi:hypothetical protein